MGVRSKAAIITAEAGIARTKSPEDSFARGRGEGAEFSGGGR